MFRVPTPRLSQATPLPPPPPSRLPEPLSTLQTISSWLLPQIYSIKLWETHPSYISFALSSSVLQSFRSEVPDLSSSSYGWMVLRGTDRLRSERVWCTTYIAGPYVLTKKKERFADQQRIRADSSKAQPPGRSATDRQSRCFPPACGAREQDLARTYSNYLEECITALAPR
ncbi:hypothetical protein PM082_012175 [Marasmius tenuissimus]|nr:hypothetical protein PM082_012175 [Marasmius tenuissimus]